MLAKRDTLAVMPTGGGKSLCYQVPALLFPGLTLVVTPLIALMQDQVAQLDAAGVPALLLNSSLEWDDYKKNMDLIRSGNIKLLYIAPESLVTARVQELLSSVRVDCLTIDEAHCISEWGHDFRPEYRKISEIRELFPNSVCLALTATATEQIRRDIKKNLRLSDPAEYVASFDRKNIFLEVIPKKNPVHQILSFLSEHPDESGIVYCFSRKQVDDLTNELRSRGYSVLPYHAGLSDTERSSNQERFLRDDVRIMVATVAFGMGINKPNVRFVIHFDLPKSLEQYYQEIGRAGRDGEPATALLLYSFGDTRKIRFFMEDKSVAETKKAEAHLKAMTAYAEARSCRRTILLGWFGETYAPKVPEITNPASGIESSCCDICSRGVPSDVNVTVPVQKVLSCIIRTGERFGAAYVIDILLGSRQKRIVENGHNKLSTWGIGRELEKEDWFELVRVLLENGYLTKDDEYGVLSLTTEARDALSRRDQVCLPFISTTTAPYAKETETGTLSTQKTPRSLKLPKPSQIRATEISDDPAAIKILASLKVLRRGLAEAASVPPYVIFSDRTLEDIAVKKPSTVKDLLEIYGIGNVKAERYGEFIMNAIRGKQN